MYFNLLVLTTSTNVTIGRWTISDAVAVMGDIAPRGHIADRLASYEVNLSSLVEILMCCFIKPSMSFEMNDDDESDGTR